jgi:hypothetical protein
MNTMKAKSTVSTLALTAMCLAGSWQPAQAIVGYVNVTLSPGYNLIHNPLTKSNNNITVVIPSPPDGTTIILWDVPSQSFGPVATYSFGAWDNTALDLPPGRGFFWYAPATYTNTFTGEVLVGHLTTFVAGNNKLSALGSKVPQGGTLSGDLAFPTIDGANAFLFNSGTQDYIDASTCFSGFGWYNAHVSVATGGPTINVAQAFFVQNPGPDTDWVRDFNPLAALPPKTSQASGATVTSVQISGGTVTLAVKNTNGGAYSVQFSKDGLSWTTVVTGVTGSVWQGKYAGGEQGYYQVVQP